MKSSRRSSRRRRHGGSVKQWVFICLIVLLGVGLVTAVVVWYFYQKREYRAVYLQNIPSIERDALKGGNPSITNPFTDEVKGKLYEGAGIKVDFVVYNDPTNGYKTSTETFEIKPWPEYEASFVNVRQAEVEEAIQKEYPKYVFRFKAPRPRTRIFELCVDDTEGINDALRDQVRSVVEGLNLPDAVSGGDTVLVFAWLLSDSDLTENQHIALLPDKSDAAASQLEKLLRWLLKDIPATKTSAISGGLSRAARENAGKQDRHFYVFSDGLQNSGRVDLYHDQALLKKEAYPKLDKLLWGKELSLPDLKKATVDWYPPPVDAAQSEKAKRALDYWEDVLKRAGATVKIH